MLNFSFNAKIFLSTIVNRWGRAKICGLALIVYNFEPPKRKPAKFQGFEFVKLCDVTNLVFQFFTLISKNCVTYKTILVRKIRM